MQDVVSTLPPGERIVNLVQDPWLRTNPVAHMIDRVCVGHCYSYANYEPSTKAVPHSRHGAERIVADTYTQSWHLQLGDYLVREEDLPLYGLDIDRDGHLRIRRLKAGAQNGASEWNILWNLPLS